MRSMNPDHPTKVALSSTYGNIAPAEHSKLDDILYVIREFVCRVDPAIHGRDERALPLTYRDAAILTSEVGNLRLKLAHASIQNQRVIEQRDRLHDFFAAISAKLSSIDPLWDDNTRGGIEQNAVRLIDTILKSAGVLQDDKPQCPNCASSADYAEETKEGLNLFRAQTREILLEAFSVIDNYINASAPGTHASMLYHQSVVARGNIETFVENLP